MNNENLYVENLDNSSNSYESNSSSKLLKILINNDSRKEGISYIKTKKLSFPVKGLTFTDIPVLKSVKLSFYEKYTILLIQKGIKCEHYCELSPKISSLLNVSEKCISEFIEYLQENDYLVYDKENKKFCLDQSIHFIIDKNLDNSMFAELDVKKADCNKIVFIDNLNMFFLEEEFVGDFFRRKGSSSSKANETLPREIIEEIYKNDEKLRPLFIKYFSSTNMHLKNDFSYVLKSEIYLDYQYEFEVMLEYKYLRKLNKSLVQNVVLLNNLLPNYFVESLVKPFEEDDKLPRFIELADKFYEKIIPNTDTILEVEDSIETEKVKVKPIEVKIDEIKEELSLLKKEYKKQKQIETEESEKIKKDIEEKEIEINESQLLLDTKDENDSELVNNLKKTIKELKSQKRSLEEELNDKETEIKTIADNFKYKEDELKAKISDKEEEINNINNSVKELEIKQKELIRENNELIQKNEKKLHPVIQEIIDKYPKSKNIYNDRVTDICIILDGAISASECESYDEMFKSIDKVRELYRKLLQVVFEVTLQKPQLNLGSYLSDPFNLLALENMLKKHKVLNVNVVKSKLVIFHELASANGHLAENGPRKHENLLRIENFKKLKLKDRESILLSIPMLFNSISLTNKEEKSIVSKLKI